ncbi:hypothetical protein [Vannielia litorea]|uniref:hypothetical protein n=1 Tax=Vannielia litorea TaxID=1217970 RepID=UPI001C987FD0|nr:hypothetical protein [Vannielia litorea]MBY6047338.1 hypothetical protein [Vannielia litorea]MBY6074752.1 hypothetical protein [Vannielia litorea]
MIRAALLSLAAALPAQAEPCLEQITPSFDLCLDGTRMAGAYLEQFGDGSRLEISEVSLDYIEDYAGRGTGTLEQDMAAFNATFEIPPENTLLTTSHSSEGRTAFVEVGNEPDSTRRVARAVTELGGTRLMVIYGAPWDAWPESLGEGVIEMVEALRLRCEGSC